MRSIWEDIFKSLETRIRNGVFQKRIESSAKSDKVFLKKKKKTNC